MDRGLFITLFILFGLLNFNCTNEEIINGQIVSAQINYMLGPAHGNAPISFVAEMVNDSDKVQPIIYDHHMGSQSSGQFSWILRNDSIPLRLLMIDKWSYSDTTYLYPDSSIINLLLIPTDFPKGIDQVNSLDTTSYKNFLKSLALQGHIEFKGLNNTIVLNNANPFTFIEGLQHPKINIVDLNK